MKKLLKIASLFVIAIVFTFGFGLNVFAESDCGDLDYNECRVGERGVIKVSGSGFVYRKLTASTQNTKVAYSGTGDTSSTGAPVNIYSKVGVTFKTTAGDVSSKTYFSSYKDSYSALYCLDAQYEGYNPLYAERFLLDTSASKKVLAFDYAIMSVLTGGGSGTNPSGITDYWARLLAIRAITYTFGFYSDAAIEYKGAFYAGFTVVNTWLKSNSSAYDTLNSALAAAGAGSLKSKSSFGSYSSYSFSGTPVNSAQNYYNNALLEAADYLNNLADEVKVETVEITAGDIQKTGDAGNEFVSKDVVHTIKLSGFNNESKFVINKNNDGIKYAEGTQYDGLTGYISKIEIENGPVFTREAGLDSILDQDLVELGYIPENQEVTIKITVHFEGWKSSTDPSITTLKCGQQPIKYSIDGTYSSENLGKYGEYVATVWYSGESQAQRYIGIEKGTNDVEKPWSSEYETYLIESCSCEDLATACEATGNINSDACQELFSANCTCESLEVKCNTFGDQTACSEMDTACEADCFTDFTPIGACCDASDQLVISTSDEVMDPYEIHGNKTDEIKACFVTKVDNGAEPVDENGNKYKMLTDSRVSDNQFCSVNCREDYTMQLPSAKRVNAGRYFSFRVAIQAKKQCFTNTIDKDLFEEKMEEAEKAIIDATNEYLYWKAAYENRTDYKYLTTSYYPDCDSETYEYAVYIEVKETDAWTYPTFQNSFYSFNSQISQKTTQDVYEVQGNIGTTYVDTISCPTYKYQDGKWVQSGSYNQRTYEINSSPTMSELEEKLTKNIESKWNSLKSGSKIKAAVEAYANLIKEYNNCALWDADYNYDPYVTYDYQEDYRDLVGMPIEMQELTKNIGGTSYQYCLQQGAGDGPTITDNEYKTCSTGFTGHQYFESEAVYTICELETAGGDPVCKRDDQLSRYRVTKARYKKSEQEASSTYKPQELFYNIYPSGEISITSGDDRVLLGEDRELPVALSTRLGIYEYYVDFTDIGEFYDRVDVGGLSPLGRLMGNDGIITDTTYVCAYLVNIPEQEFFCDAGNIPTCSGPNCISDCIGPNCDDLDCDGDNCVPDCVGVGCIYDEDAGTSLVEKTVSLNNLFPNGTDSYNWNKSENDKAITTISEIEGAGNTVYDGTPILSITIDPSAARTIQQYNDSVENDGGYSNATLDCYSLNGYEEIACYSRFITDLIDGVYGNTVVNANSLIANSSYRTVTNDNTEYFTLWNGRISEDDMLGPSWK